MCGSVLTGSGCVSLHDDSLLRLRKASICAFRATWYIQAVNDVFGT